MNVAALNPNLVRLIALFGRGGRLDGEPAELLSEVSGLVPGPDSVIGDGDTTRYIDEAKRLIASTSTVDERKQFVKDLKDTFATLNPRTFDVERGNQKLTINTARFIEFLYEASIGALPSVQRLSEHTNPQQLLVYSEHEQFSPFLRASVEESGTDKTDELALLKNPEFLKAIFQEFVKLDERA